MTEPRSSDDRRAQHVAAFGFVLQLACYAALLGVSLWAESDAVAAVSRFMIIGLPVWLILFLVFKQMRRVSAESLETAELKRARAAGGGTGIFEFDAEALLIEQSRLQWMVRWLLPLVTVILAVVLLGGHFVGWGWTLENAFASVADGGVHRTQQPTLMMWFVVFAGFLCFLYARYSLALARMPEWRLLRAGAICMAGNAVACLALAIALMAGTTLAWAEPLVAYLVRVLLLVLGVEFTANFVLDFYRPRAPGVVPRPSFESRFLGLIGEPGGIARSLAEAINYQFGFEVSSTWFYQLLQRWLFPLMVATCVVVLLLTSVVIVDADEDVVVERFGRQVGGEQGVLAPGLHMKLPFPVDVVHRAPVRRVRELVVGEATKEDDHDVRQAVVWTESHDFVPELMLLVASPALVPTVPEPGTGSGEARPASESVAVSLLMVSVPIEFRIKDIRRYLYGYDDPVKLLECIAYQHLCDYAASVDIDQLMGPGREAFNAGLRELIQRRLDELGTGIEVAFAGIRGAHPPAEKEVASTFQAVISAKTRMAAVINAAHGEAQKRLTAVAGTEARALQLDEAIRERDRLRAESPARAEELAAAQIRVDELLLGSPGKGITPLSGNAAAEIAAARSRAVQLIADAASKVRVFSTDLAAYTAAPALYQQRKILEVYAGLEGVRKYLIIGDPRSVIVEYNTAEEGGLDQVLSEGVSKKK
ncbi:MAG: hypothetical protein HY763_13190 [Planctomycetes bacterium]|nr:hypothetical protein [Planctomycetota bacterium]